MLLQNISIRVGQKNPILDEILQINRIANWMVITAWNNFESLTEISSATTLTDINRRNQDQNEQLLKNLKILNAPILPCWGIADNASWPPEASFLVLGLSRAEIPNWLEQYQQCAVVYGDFNHPAELIMHSNYLSNPAYLATTYLVLAMDLCTQSTIRNYWKHVLGFHKITGPFEELPQNPGLIYPLQRPIGQYLQFQR